MSARIAVDQLTPGIYIQLDGGWWSHPFARSAFKLQSQEQIDSLRALGLREVAWVPALSDSPAVAPPRPATEATPVPPPQPEPAAATQAACSELQDAQAARLAERRLAQARSAWRNAAGLALAQPQQVVAGLAPMLADLEQLLQAPELSLRALDGASGDAASHHAVNVAVLAMLLGRACGLAGSDLAELGLGALLHDVGKLALPAQHRQAPVAGARAAEVAAYRDHVAQGLALGRQMGLAPAVLAVLAQHHEHADGSGFPQGLHQAGMALPARIVALVNAYDGLCHPPLGAPGLSPHEALAQLFAQRRAQFDPALLNALIRLLGVYPPGTLVQLTDERYALVTLASAGRALKPTVLATPSAQPRAAAETAAQRLDLELLPQLGIRRSVPAQALPAWARSCLAPLRRVAYLFEPAAAPAAA